MTQQYIIGQFSVLLEDLRPPVGEWLTAVHDLRSEVEASPLPMLPRLAREALDLADKICWAALEHRGRGRLSRLCESRRGARGVR